MIRVVPYFVQSSGVDITLKTNSPSMLFNNYISFHISFNYQYITVNNNLNTKSFL